MPKEYSAKSPHWDKMMTKKGKGLQDGELPINAEEMRES
jgi:hypothetical protein